MLNFSEFYILERILTNARTAMGLLLANVKDGPVRNDPLSTNYAMKGGIRFTAVLNK